jgi:hypothetical protein
VTELQQLHHEMFTLARLIRGYVCIIFEVSGAQSFSTRSFPSRVCNPVMVESHSLGRTRAARSDGVCGAVFALSTYYYQLFQHCTMEGCAGVTLWREPSELRNVSAQRIGFKSIYLWLCGSTLDVAT